MVLTRSEKEAQKVVDVADFAVAEGDKHIYFRIEYQHDQSVDNPLIINLGFPYGDFKNVTETYHITKDGMINFRVRQVKDIVTGEKFRPSTSQSVYGLLKHSDDISNLLENTPMSDNIQKFEIVQEIKNNAFKNNYQNYLLQYAKRR